MDTVWVAYVKDHRQRVPMETTIGIFDSSDKAERAIQIVLQRLGWHGKRWCPNVYLPQERYEYGWREIPFNRFDTNALWVLAGKV